MLLLTIVRRTALLLASSMYSSPTVVRPTSMRLASILVWKVFGITGKGGAGPVKPEAVKKIRTDLNQMKQDLVNYMPTNCLGLMNCLEMCQNDLVADSF